MKMNNNITPNLEQMVVRSYIDMIHCSRSGSERKDTDNPAENIAGDNVELSVKPGKEAGYKGDCQKTSLPGSSEHQKIAENPASIIKNFVSTLAKSVPVVINQFDSGNPEEDLRCSISPEGKRLSEMLDGFDIENRWLRGEYVDWETGLKTSDTSAGCHCSAFIAAVCLKKGIYILRPPDHPLRLLSNAQCTWLAEKGKDYGWEKVPNALEAQRHANNGYIVIAGRKNSNPEKPGHMAIVRPSDKSEKTLMEEGPQLTQAGFFNYSSVSLKKGFNRHPRYWINANRHSIDFFVNKNSTSKEAQADLKG